MKREKESVVVVGGGVSVFAFSWQEFKWMTGMKHWVL